MAKTVFDVLREKIEDDMSSASNFLSNGGAKDFAQYKEITGMLRGLTSCMNHVNDLSRNYLEDDND
jgi:hypothetical protein|tara:strand:- start:1324 stop:1521 length:198 start_codon:yes stop_codon:yes gene_type:complete